MCRQVRAGVMSPARAQTVAVIGAGLAGLACAQQLQVAGHAVTLFEQSDTPGGRMRHCAGEHWQCDHGAQYFTARDPAFVAVVNGWIDAGSAAPWLARIASWDGTQLRRSQSALMRYVGVPDMAAPARTLAAHLDVRLSTEVRALQRSGQRWSVLVGQDAAALMVDAVLLAVPAPGAARLLERAAPALSSVAQDAHMQPAWALMLRFDAPVDPGYDAVFVNTGPLRWVARNSSKPARTGAETWLLHATAAWSQAHYDATPAHVIASIMPELAALGLPMPQSCDAYRWTVASSEPASQIGCVWDAQLGLGMCGDWLAAGKVEGAWQSGVALAQRVAAGDVTHSGCG
ncbi:NAD(P)/FAD-dependent oxidoreductase [Xanthomonas nasturtii]|uniref:FAD-dependent oxidoreductase n=1 Tax=Xanthomonas nasturtii TaxID=1843581 RepID=A0ABT0LLK1_9XANT|nr:FAD-dependent oxidoreductase [Xanthomonas nasturtii]MCL1549897.1 FAD-dependent oxidoreductase [Xanthomonas nasturtii]MCL1553947.1 FAD-dependent oxidoreductase [Xanthomonas nasturtii]